MRSKDWKELFTALADETRLRILNLLSEGELCVCDIMTVLKEPQSKVSRHLAYLRKAGLVDARRDGLWMYYSHSRSVAAAVKTLLRSLKSACSRCDDFRSDIKLYKSSKSRLVACCK